MNKRCNFILYLFILTAFNICAQPAIRDAFPDSVKPRKPWKIFTVINLDSLKPEMIDTLTNPEGFIFWSHLNGVDGPYFGLKEKGFYKYFNVGGEHGGNGIGKAERINFKGGDKKQFLLYYSFSMGNPHFSESHNGFIIWDLDKVELLADFEYSYSYWLYPAMEPDSAGDYHLVDSNDEGKKDCYDYEPTFKKGLITFTEKSHPCEWDDGHYTLLNPNVIKYRLINGVLVKLNNLPMDSVKKLFKKNSMLVSYSTSNNKGKPYTFNMDSIHGEPWGGISSIPDTMRMWIFNEDNTFNEYYKTYHGRNPYRKLVDTGTISFSSDDYHIYIKLKTKSSVHKFIFVNAGLTDLEFGHNYKIIVLNELK